jgi:hypothetical protein
VSAALEQPSALVDVPNETVGTAVYPKGPVVLRVCAWCQSFLGLEQYPEIHMDKTIVSHGMCEPCATAWAANAGGPQVLPESTAQMARDGVMAILEPEETPFA